MEIRAYDAAHAVSYLERDYDKCKLHVAEDWGRENSRIPDLCKTQWGFEIRGPWSTHIQPMFTLKYDEYEPTLYFCGWCSQGLGHECSDCGNPMTHMQDDECLYCWDEDLKAIANRPPEEDPKEW